MTLVSYCLNPNCPRPENEPDADVCTACGSALLLHGRYRAVRPLGKGGFGATFLATEVIQKISGSPSCVIKQLRPTSQSPSVIKMAKELFEREAQTLARVGVHPQIPRLLDYFEEGGNFYLVQEYIEGETLKQEFERRGIFNEAEVRQILLEILPTLAFMHQHGVIHRDIKPANIIRRRIDGQLVLIDFGAVTSQKPQYAQQEEDPGALLTNFAIGTPGFAPPEQMQMRPVFSSDLYATAMTCLYLMTGRSPKDFPYDPYTGEINWKGMVQMSEPLRQIFEKMLKQVPAQRYRSAEEVLKALKEMRVPATPTPVAPAISSNIMRTPIRGSDISNSQIQAARAKTPASPPNSGVINVDTQAHSRFGELKGGRRVIAEYNQGKRNFANQDLSKVSLGSAELPGIVLSRSKLVEAELSYANLSGSSFQGANLTAARLSGANLENAKMQRAILQKADLSSCMLGQCDLAGANLSHAYLLKADLSGANLSNANLKGAYLLQANLKGANLCGADLKGAKVTEEQLAQAKTNWGTIRPDGTKRLF